MSFKIRWVIVWCAVIIFPSLPAAAQGPNIQERRAIQEVQAMAMKKQQEIAIFKKQRDELLAGYKALQKAKNDAAGQMKISQRDYTTAMAKFNQAKLQEEQLQAQVTELRQNSSKLDSGVLERQMKKLRDDQSKLIDNMKSYSKIQQDSYESMMTADNQHRNLLVKDQVLRQQIENVQRQLQFVASQP